MNYYKLFIFKNGGFVFLILFASKYVVPVKQRVFVYSLDWAFSVLCE